MWLGSEGNQGRMSLKTSAICILLWYIRLCDSQVTLELCAAPIKGRPCLLRCISPDVEQSVVFKKDNTEYASCKFILGTLSCTSIYPTRYLISQPSSPFLTLLNITQLSRAGDEGSWSCDHASTGSTSNYLTVLTEPTKISTSVGGDIDYCTGDQSATYHVTLNVTCSSAVSISAELFSQTTGKTYTESLTVIKGPACADVEEHMYTAVFTIRSTTGGLTGDGYILTFKTQLSAGVGEVYETVFPGDISFPCPAPSSTTTLKSNDNILLNIIILLSIIIITA